MNIKKISKLKDGRYKIILDDKKIVTYDDILLKYNLLYKKELNDDILEKIKEENTYYNNYNLVLRYVTKKVRCTNEVKIYMDKLEINDDDKNKIFNKLVDLNLINDRLYANCYINDRLILSKDGINKIRKYLLDNKIDSNIIDEELDKFEINEYDKLKHLIIKKINSNKKYSSNKLKNKIVTDMLNLGYNYDDIINIYDEYSKDDYEILLKEYLKVYNKLKKKYKGNELEYKIKYILYSKGFNYDSLRKEDLMV